MSQPTRIVQFEKISLPNPWKVTGNSDRWGRGTKNAKNFQGKCEAKLEFPEG